MRSEGGESVSELMIDKKKKKQLQETVHSTLLLGCIYFWIYCILTCLVCIVDSFKLSCV